MTASTPSNRFSSRGFGSVFLVAAGAIAVACGGNDASHPPLANDTNTTSTIGSTMGASSATGSSAAGSSGTPGSSSAGATGAGGSTGSSASTGSGGGPIDAGSDATPSIDGAAGSTGTGGGAGAGPSGDGGPVAAARCDPDTVWSTLGRVASIPADGFTRFGAITPDELTAAWSDVAGGVYVAERESSTQPFGAPAKVNDGGTLLAPGKIALSPTGNGLIAIRADRGGFVGFDRMMRSDAFAPSTGLEFTQVRVVFEGGAQAFEPVLGADKRSFYFVLSSNGRAPSIYESAWDGSQASWGFAARIPNAEVQGTDVTHRRRPTGASVDGRTLFFFDEIVDAQFAAWRDNTTAPFRVFKALGPFPEAAPNLRCDTIYYQGRDTLGNGLFSAE